MSHRISIAGRDIAFASEPGETVLEAAERAGYAIPYSCRRGACATCEGALVAGEVALGGATLRGPCDQVLLCRAAALSDLEIRPQRIERTALPARKTLTATVYRILRPAPDVSVVQLRFPAGNRVKFKAGQYLQILLEGGDRRSFSMANPPQESDGAQLHIRHVAGGAFSERVLGHLKPGDKLDVETPYGQFFLSDEPEGRPMIILLATGTGFAPIKSIVEDAAKRNLGRTMHFYWGARRAADLYMADLPRKWAERYSWFSFVPVLSEPDADWAGRSGLVHRAVLDDYSDLSGCEVYACGNPAMTEAARREFTAEARLPDGSFHCDAFVPSGAETPALAEA